MTRVQLFVAAHRKAELALLGLLITWAQATFVDGTAAHVVALVVLVLTAAGVYGTPNDQAAAAALYGPATRAVEAVTSRAALVLAVHARALRKGAHVTVDVRDWTIDRLRATGRDVSRVWLTLGDRLHLMLLNDRLRDCTIAGYLKLLMILAAIAGIAVPVFDDDDALELYEKWAGYRLGVPSTDRGDDPRQVLLHGQKEPVKGLRIGPFASVPVDDVDAIRAALREHGALYSSLDLPDDYENLGFNWVIRPHDVPDPSEGHEVVLVMSGRRLYALTWGGVAHVSVPFLLRFFVLHLAVEGLAGAPAAADLAAAA